MNPYLPPMLANLAIWSANFSAMLTAAPTDYGLIAGDAVIVAAADGPFQAAYALSSVPATRTPVTVADTAAARATLEAVIRPYAVRISLNQTVDPALKVGIGVTVRAGSPTPVPQPTTAPDIAVLGQINGLATMSYTEPGTIGKAKPYGVIAAEVAVALGTVVAIDPEIATRHVHRSKSPFTLDFSAPDRGKYATIWARWITRSGPGGKGQVGPWSTSASFVVA